MYIPKFRVDLGEIGVSLDTGHFWLCSGTQGLNKEFEPTNEWFNAVYQI